MSWVSAGNQCATTRNTIITPCTLACAQGTYKTAPCTISSDTACAACSQTPVGHVTTVQCTPTTDTSWARCPDGMACFGGRNYSSCPPPRLVSGGRCICPNATHAETDMDMAQCLPISCSPGLYPDIDTNQCRACTAQGVLCHAAQACPMLILEKYVLNVVSTIFNRGPPYKHAGRSDGGGRVCVPSGILPDSDRRTYSEMLAVRHATVRREDTDAKRLFEGTHV